VVVALGVQRAVHEQVRVVRLERQVLRFRFVAYHRGAQHQVGRDYATNVLTFDYSRSPVVAADLVLCAPVVRDEAKAQRLPLQAHYAHLLVHGTLHAQGYDHENEADARVMEARESELLQSLGFGDPYAR